MATLLVIDDEEDLLEIIEMELEMAGFGVITARGLREAKENIRKGGFDGVLTDYRMPDGTGSDILEYLQEQNVFVPCFIITGFADISPEKAYEMGAWGYFAKPSNLKSVTTAITNALIPAKERFTKSEAIISAKTTLKFISNSYDNALGKGQIRIEKGGFYILTNIQKVRKGDQIEFDLKFGKQTLTGIGVIRWIRSHNLSSHCYLGVEFIYLDELSYEYYEDIIRKSTVPSVYIPMHPAA